MDPEDKRVARRSLRALHAVMLCKTGLFVVERLCFKRSAVLEDMRNSARRDTRVWHTLGSRSINCIWSKSRVRAYTAFPHQG